MFALLDDQIASRPAPIKKVTVYVNGSVDKSLVMQYKHELQFQELAKALEGKWGSRFGKNVRLFNSEGVEYDNHDLSNVKDNENLYVSRGTQCFKVGEQFDPNSGFCEYQMLKEIGEGGFGKVLLARHKSTGDQVAIKVMKADKITNAASIDQIFREVESLKALQHPNIVRIHNCYALREMQVVLIMEYLEGGELLQYLQSKGRLTLNEAMVFFKQIVSAINFCHSKNIVHRDLKLENVLLKKKNCAQVKVADFGIAGIADRANPNIDCGTLKYMAPEVLSGAEKENSPAADVWALGCIFYYLLEGRPPFVGKTGQQTKQLILSGNYKHDPKISVGRPAEKLIAKMLEPSAKMRIKTDAIVHQLHKLEDKVNFYSSASDDEEEQKKEPGKTVPLRCPNPEAELLSAAKFRKELRYRHLRPLNIFPHMQSQQQPRNQELDLSALEQPKKFLIRKPERKLTSMLETPDRRRNSLNRKSFSYRDRVVATPSTPCTPCGPTRMRSRESIFDIKRR